MNANGWPLHEMEREVFDVPYSLAECEARLERLHEPEPRNSFFARDGDHVSRTNVINLAEKYPANRAVPYCVQRVKRFRPLTFRVQPDQNIDHVYAEMNVVLQYEVAANQVILYTPTRMTKAQKSNLIQLAVSGPFAILVITVMSLARGGAMVFVPFIFLALIVYTFISILLQYARQRRILRRKIMKALSLDPSQKE